MATVGYNLSLPESWISASPSPPALVFSSTSSDVCQHNHRSLLQNDLIYFLLPVWGCHETLVFYQIVVPRQLTVQFWVGSVFHCLCLTTSHDFYLAANTVGLWLHSSGNGYIKRKWIHMWGLAQVLACWRRWLEEQRGVWLATEDS